MEADDIRRAGFHQPIAILPNGVVLPPPTHRGRGWLDATRPEFKGKRLALFLSRLHRKKGVEELLLAWARLEPSVREGWQLVVAGADLTGYLPALEKHRVNDPRPESISFTGEVKGELKEALLHHADFLVLPTKEENFGIVVAEALASGTPVITTRAAPWEALESHQCGWWIAGTQDALVNSLITAMTCSPESLQARGKNGHDYVTRVLDWRSIAKNMADFYSWIIDRQNRPGFVRID